MALKSTEHEPKVGELLKDTFDGLGDLVASHFKLLRAELVVDARAYGRRAIRVVIAASLLLIGYALTCVASALALARVTGAPVAFLAIGGANLVGAVIALRVVLAHTPGPPLGVTRAELDQTVAVFTPERNAANAHH